MNGLFATALIVSLMVVSYVGYELVIAFTDLQYGSFERQVQVDSIGAVAFLLCSFILYSSWGSNEPESHDTSRGPKPNATPGNNHSEISDQGSGFSCMNVLLALLFILSALSILTYLGIKKSRETVLRSNRAILKAEQAAKASSPTKSRP